MSKEEKKVNRRDFLFTASYTVGAVGVGAVIWPMIDQMNPDKAQQALATTEVDISNIEPGKSITVLWRGKPVFLKRRTSEEIAEAKARRNGDEVTAFLGHLGIAILEPKRPVISVTSPRPSP